MKPVVHVYGDPTIDWMFVRNEGSFDKVSLSSQAGGSILISNLLKSLLGESAEVYGPDLDPVLLRDPMNSSITGSWTTWRAYLDERHNKPSCRISEGQENETGFWNYEKSRISGTPDLLVLEDSGLGFRNTAQGWPEFLSETLESDSTKDNISQHLIPQHIILKLSKYNEKNKNPLVEKIVKLGLGRRTAVITSLHDLRACAVKVDDSLSWEKMLDDIVEAIYSPYCPFVDTKSRALKFSKVIVNIGSSGSVVADSDSNTLIFDRSGQEGDFSGKFQGRIIGYNTCIMCAVASRWVETEGQLNWGEAVRTGVGLARLLEAEGYEVVEDKHRRSIQFPYEKLASAYKSICNNKFGKDPDKILDLGIFTENPANKRDKKDWSILEETVKSGYDVCSDKGVSSTLQAVFECARVIAEKGPNSALKNIPLETVGKWKSADRIEIEGVRSVNNAIKNYLSLKNQETPLSLAVFGPPGSGKSFAIKEIARGLGIGKESILTFNLSQFESPGELPAAFHQIRDLHLKGKTPLVFWDEFDTPCEGKLLGWLRYFLAPMQDGEFTDRGSIHPVGGGIYVFAGATRHSFEEFSLGNSPEELAAKKPDFISRLRAFINVKGPNGIPNSLEDKLYIIRRAFLLNHFMGIYAAQTKKADSYQIEASVLNALLKVNRYRHGARSIETIIRMSSLAEKEKFELSSLPPEQVLKLHVDADEFLSLTRFGHLEPLRIGITGHIGLDPEGIGEIEKGVRAAVKFIENKYPGSSLTAFSPMAVGGDRLVGRIILEEEGNGLIAVLPVPMEDYVNDFGRTDKHHIDYNSAAARQEFRYWLKMRAIEVIEMPFFSSRHEAYQKTGYFISENSDVVIAVWDGKEAQGKGGTGEIVQIALEYGKPVCHIWAGNYKADINKRTSVGNKLGTFRHVNFSGFPPKEWIG